MNPTGWRIDPDTLGLANRDLPDDGNSTTFTAEQVAAQQWPPCPVCGTAVTVSQIDVTLNERDLLENGRSYIHGPWECPRGCNPFSGQRLHASQEFGREMDGTLNATCSCGVREHGLDPDAFARFREQHPTGSYA